MGTTVRVRDIGSKLCEVVGVDPNTVSSISFKWGAGQKAIITFGYIPTPEQAEEFSVVFKNYELQEIPDGSDD